MNSRNKVLSFGAGGLVLLGLMQACGTNESAPHPGALLDGGGSGGESSDASNGAGGSRVVKSGPIGKACSADSDCAAGLTCVTSTSKTFAGDGPADGMCSLDCSTGDDSTCQAFDPSAVCLGVDQAGINAYCFEGCTVGPVNLGATKCHGRKNVACVSQTSNSGGTLEYCFPQCRGDFDCGTRKCNLGTGLCSDTQAVGNPIGTRCNPSASAKNTCAAGCIPVAGGFGFCSAGCILGQAGCGIDPTSKAPTAASCEFIQNGDESTGDFGFCGQLCDCDGDCLDPDLICSAFPADVAVSQGRAGSCSPPDATTTGIACVSSRDAGRESGAGGSAGTGGKSGAVDAGPDAHPSN